MQSQQVQHALENAKATVAAEVQVVQAQVAAEKGRSARSQQEVEAER
jgi:acyl-CoA thioesterase FadM